MSDSHEMKYSGKVKGIHEDYEDPNLVRLDVEPGNHPKRKKKKSGEIAWRETRSETVSAEMARNLSIDDRVEVVTIVRKPAKRSRPQVR